MNVLESRHAVDTGRAKAESKYAAKKACACDAAAIDHLNSGETVVSAVVASANHWHLGTCDNYSLIILNSSSSSWGRWSLMLMMMVIFNFDDMDLSSLDHWSLW